MTPDHPQKITFGEMRSSGVRDVLVYCRDHHCATTSGSAPSSGRITSSYPILGTGSSAGFAASVVRISGRTFRRVAWAPPMMWRMLNAEAVIFMGWNAGTDRRLDR
jgi:hypothetical protein